jgi:hypothetical protein
MTNLSFRLPLPRVRSGADPSEASPASGGILRRIVEVLAQAKRRRAEREIAALFARRGGALTGVPDAGLVPGRHRSEALRPAGGRP